MFDIGSILLTLSLLILVGLFIARPFFERRTQNRLADPEDVSSLLAERDRILDALQELDFDHSLGKIPEDTYPAQRGALLERGAAVLKQLDEYQIALPANQGFPEVQPEGTLMAGATAGPAQRPQVAFSDPDDELEAMIAARRRARAEKAGGFCPGCGQAVKASDQFCANCGSTLK